jgi:hypothetical protein
MPNSKIVIDPHWSHFWPRANLSSFLWKSVNYQSLRPADLTPPHKNYLYGVVHCVNFYACFWYFSLHYIHYDHSVCEGSFLKSLSYISPIVLGGFEAQKKTECTKWNVFTGLWSSLTYWNWFLVPVEDQWSLRCWGCIVTWTLSGGWFWQHFFQQHSQMMRMMKAKITKTH